MLNGRCQSSKDKRCVSEVIGVILMVSISVVLATVLYLWASELGTTGRYSGMKTNIGHIAETSGSVENYHVVILVTINRGDTWIMDALMKIYDADGILRWTIDFSTMNIIVDGVSHQYWYNETVGSKTYTMYIIDNDGNGRFNSGDYIVFENGTVKPGWAIDIEIRGSISDRIIVP